MPDLSVDLVIAAPADRVWNAISPGFDRIGDWATAIPRRPPSPLTVTGRVRYRPAMPGCRSPLPRSTRRSLPGCRG
jgi:hypothetical protein